MIICKSKQEARTSSSSSGELTAKATTFIDKEIAKYQSKAAARSSLLARNKEEREESTNSVDDIYKKDTEMSAALPLMKIFGCHPDQIKGRLT